MKKGVLWLTLTGIIIFSLILVSCGKASTSTTPASQTQTTAPATTSATVKTTATTTAATTTKTTATTSAQAEKPKYGGIFNIAHFTDITSFGFPVFGGSQSINAFVYEQLLVEDWAKGPAGTGETTFGGMPSGGSIIGGGVVRWEDVTGRLAESWEQINSEVTKLNIRRGVRFALDPTSEASRLANGREMTVDDVIYSINYLLKDSRGYTYGAQAGFAKAASVEKTGPWQITVKTPVDPGLTFQWITQGGGIQWIWAKEVQEKYGQTNDWRHQVGTGPYMIADLVPSSSIKLIRNPNYWQKNPAGPGKGDQLPYPDGINILIIPDMSTRMAAIRTAKVDRLDDIEWEDTQSLIKTNPSLKYYRYIPAPNVIAMRTDKADLPYKDKRVRQALMLATDFETIKNGLYGGQAEIFTFPLMQIEGVKSLFTPIEQLPESSKTLFKYNPERAKQLLAEAGYPKGFKANIVVQSTPRAVDSISIYKEMWAKVGIDLVIDPKETAVYTSMQTNRTAPEMIFAPVQNLSFLNTRYVFASLRGKNKNNNSYVNDPAGTDPKIEAAFQEIQKNIVINYPKADQIILDLVPYIVEQAYYIPKPASYTCRLWQPWVKNYFGEAAIRCNITYVWIDQDLKRQMPR